MMYYYNQTQVIQESLEKLKAYNQDELFKHRDMLINYYQYQNTESFIEEYFPDSLRAEIPLYTTNITKKIINRISMVYKDKPVRYYNQEVNQDLENIFYKKDMQLKTIERIHNLIGTMLINILWNEQEERIEYRPVIEYSVAVNPDNPTEILAIMYPMVKTKDSIIQNDDDMYVYWSKEDHFMVDCHGNKISINEADVNPYGIIPFVTVQPHTVIDEYFNIGEGADIALANRQIDISMTMLQHHIRCAGGQLWVGGRVDADHIKLGLNKVTVIEDGTLNTLSNQTDIRSIMEGIEHQIQHICSNHHIAFDFGISTQKSGVAVKLENLELLEAREDDVEKFRMVENDMYKIEKTLLDVHMNMAIPDDFSIDFTEITFPDPKEELALWDWWIANGIKDKVDYIMETDPDKFETREEAIAFLEERQTQRADNNNIFSLRNEDDTA